MKFEKIFCFILSLILIFCSMIIPADAVEINNVGYEFKRNIIKHFEIIPDEDIEIPDKVVTRAEFAAYAAKMAEIGKVENKMYFTDVPVSHKDNGYINALTDRGVIDRAEDGMFNPDVPITYSQAVKIMIVIAGYKDYALAEAEIMTGYVKAAKKTGIATSVKNPEAITIKEAVEIIYNTMNTEVPEFLGQSKDGLIYRVYGGNTMMERRNIFFFEGVVDAVYGASMRENIEAESGYAYIDGEKYKVGENIDVESFFGRSVTLAYSQNGSYTRVLISIESDCDEITVSGKYIKDYDEKNGILKFYPDKNSRTTKEIHIEKGGVTVVNGGLLKSEFGEVIKQFLNGERKGELTFIKDENEKYSTVIVKSYNIYIARGYNDEEGVLAGYYQEAGNIDLSKYDVVRIMTESRWETVIPQGFPAVLAVALSQDMHYAEVVVCSKSASGTLNSLNRSGKTVKLGEKEYEISDKLLEKIEAGDNVTLLFDLYGEAVFAEKTDTDTMKLGYLIDIACSKNGFDNTVKFKLYTDGKVTSINVAERVEMDGEKFKTTDTMNFLRAFPLIEAVNINKGDVSVERQIIRYIINESGEISQIDTIEVGENEDKENSLIRKYDGSSMLYYNSAMKRFGMDTLYDSSSAKVFCVPSLNSDGNVVINGEERKPTGAMYGVGYSFVSDTGYYIETYNYNYDNEYTDVIVCRTDSIKETYCSYMFDNVYEAINEDDVPTSYVKLWTKEGEVSFELDESVIEKINSINQGDIIYAYFTTDGKISDVVKMYDAESMSFTGTNKYWYAGNFNPNDFWAYRNEWYQLSKTYPYDIVGSTIYSAYEKSDLVDGKIDEAVNVLTTPIIAYDKDIDNPEKRIFIKSKSDIKTYKNYLFECSTMLASTSKSSLRCIFLYE